MKTMTYYISKTSGRSPFAIVPLAILGLWIAGSAYPALAQQSVEPV